MRRRLWRSVNDANPIAHGNADAKPNAHNCNHHRNRGWIAAAKPAGAALNAGSEWATWRTDHNAKHGFDRSNDVHRANPRRELLFPNDVHGNTATVTGSHAAPANRDGLR